MNKIKYFLALMGVLICESTFVSIIRGWRYMFDPRVFPYINYFRCDVWWHIGLTLIIISIFMDGEKK